MDIIGPDCLPIRVGVLPIAGYALMSYAATVEPLRAANLLSRRTLYETINIGIDTEPVVSSGAASVTTQALVGDDLTLDFLFVVAGGNPADFDNRRVLAWLRRLARQGVQMGGVSGGPVILARAGLMDGRRMTVHWEHAEALAELSPHLLIERSLFVIDRDRVTCAGGTAPMDLMHALLARHHGPVFARLVADWFIHTEIRPPVGPQRGSLIERVGSVNAAVLDAVQAMESHVADPLTLPQLAATAGVSARQLNRLFSAKLGRSTMEYYRDLRLEKALKLVQKSPLSLTEIAFVTGFTSSSHFTRAFGARFGRPPSSHR